MVHHAHLGSVALFDVAQPGIITTLFRRAEGRACLTMATMRHTTSAIGLLTYRFHPTGRPFSLANSRLAPSKIERIAATTEDSVPVAYGVRSNSSATAMVASSHALHSLIIPGAGDAAITLENILEAHRVLTIDDPHDSHWFLNGRPTSGPGRPTARGMRVLSSLHSPVRHTLARKRSTAFRILRELPRNLFSRLRKRRASSAAPPTHRSKRMQVWAPAPSLTSLTISVFASRAPSTTPSDPSRSTQDSPSNQPSRR